MNKNQIRQQLLQVRKNIPEDIRDMKNKKITDNIEKLDIFKKAQHILFYYSFNAEVNTHFLVEKYISKKQLYLPVVDWGMIKAMPISNPLELEEGPYGLMQPTSIKEKSFDSVIDLVITPGLAFDKNGNRLGMGKGYYDRYFAINHSCVKLGLAYAEQVLDSVPKEKYDVPVDLIVTDQKVYYCH